MKKIFAGQIGIVLCGLITSILVAVVDNVIARMTGYDPFTFSVWVVVPIGAILIGFAAASGYYFGSLYFHRRANALLLVQMVAIAGFTQLLIYYLGYTTLVLNDGRRVADFIPFIQYLDISLTSAHVRLGRALTTDTGAVGSFGYWLAAIQFVGVLLGGVGVFCWLLGKPVCRKCDLYLRPLSKKVKTFPTSEAASTYYDVVFTHPVDSSEFASLIQHDGWKAGKLAPGNLQITTTLHSCPQCKDQLIEDKVKAYNGKDWKDVNELTRRTSIPEGMDLASVFRG